METENKNTKEEKPRQTLAENIATGAVIAILLPTGMLISGFVLSKLWLWFVVPFHVVQLSPIHIAGLLLIASYFKPGGRKCFEEEKSLYVAIKAFAVHFLFNSVALSIGVIFKHWM